MQDRPFCLSLPWHASACDAALTVAEQSRVAACDEELVDTLLLIIIKQNGHTYKGTLSQCAVGTFIWFDTAKQMCPWLKYLALRHLSLT